MNGQESPSAVEKNLQSRLKAVKATEQFDLEIMEQFSRFIVQAPDEELIRMSPLRYAAKANIPEQVAIELFLYATHAGILDFNWGTICPICGALLTKKSGLRWLQARTRCTLCQLDVTPNIEELSEVSFTVSPSVHPIRFHDLNSLDFQRDGLFVFFSSSVVHYPEIHQILHSAYQAGYQVEDQSTLEFNYSFTPSHYVLMVPATHAASHIAINDDGYRTAAKFEVLFDGQLIPESISLAPGERTIVIHNRTRQPVIVGLMRDSRMAPTPSEERSGSLFTLTPY